MIRMTSVSVSYCFANPFWGLRGCGTEKCGIRHPAKGRTWKMAPRSSASFRQASISWGLLS